MSDPIPDAPNALDALAVEGQQPFQLVDPDDPTRIGYLRPQLFGDIRAYVHKPNYLEKVVVLVERCGDETALEILDAMTPPAAFAKYQEWEKALAEAAGK